MKAFVSTIDIRPKLRGSITVLLTIGVVLAAASKFRKLKECSPFVSVFAHLRHTLYICSSCATKISSDHQYPGRTLPLMLFKMSQGGRM